LRALILYPPSKTETNLPAQCLSAKSRASFDAKAKSNYSKKSATLVVYHVISIY